MSQGRIIIRNEIVQCSIHGDLTEAKAIEVGGRTVYTRWTCVECGATTTNPKER